MMEREIKLLREKIQDLSEENVALREINVKFQLENFKLQQRIRNLENSDSTVIAFNESAFDATAEYLEEDQLEAKPRDNFQQRNSRPSSKRTYQNAFDNEIEDEVQNGDINIKQESADDLKIDDDFTQEVQSDIEGLDSDDVGPKDAATIVFKLAAKRGQLEKLKTLDHGKQKDASFVNKCLDLFFTRLQIANSSARGQKCPKKPDAPIRPALDPKKLNICRQAFIYRLKREGLTVSAREDRLKNFFAYVNFKIQNARKLLQKKKERTGSME
jgi:hypothetical protein